MQEKGVSSRRDEERAYDRSSLCLMLETGNRLPFIAKPSERESLMISFCSQILVQESS